MSESDGIDEAIRGTMRSAITAAGYAGQQIAQAITDRARHAAQLSEQESRQLQTRYDAERAAARSHLAVVDRQEWWDSATPEKVGRVWETANAWRGHDTDIDRAARTIEQQVQSRYGIDAGELAERGRAARLAEVRQAAERRSDYDRARDWAVEHDPALLAAHEREQMGTDDASQSRRNVDQFVQTWRERTDAGLSADAARATARADERSAAAVLAQPAEMDGTVAGGRAEHELGAEILYDSAERRQQLAERLDAAGIDGQAKETRLISDASQAVPSNAAIARGKKAPKARRARPQGRQQDRSISR